jgi:hypothetical protein
MAEQLDLTTPITTTRTTYFVSKFHLDGWTEPTPTIVVGVVGSDGFVQDFTYTGEQAAQRLSVLNTANLTTKSLEKRLLEVLVNDGKLPPGTVSGTPR